MIIDESIIKKTLTLDKSKIVYTKQGEKHTIELVDSEQTSHLIMTTINSQELQKALALIPTLVTVAPVVKRTRKPRVVKIKDEL